jgi:threonine dehydrogenase-like Zn-dependent dehydrogenase
MLNGRNTDIQAAEVAMKALVWHGTTDIRCDSVPDPRIEHERDAIIKVTSCAICGSDLHLYDHFMPGMKSGDVMGHETMGEVVEVGPSARKSLKVGDRVVIPFTKAEAPSRSTSKRKVSSRD